MLIKMPTSGNFIIGENLSIEGFDRFVKPRLETLGYSTPDKIELYICKQPEDNILLVSISGMGDLEVNLHRALVQAGEDFEKEKPRDTQRTKISYLHEEEIDGKKVDIHKGIFHVLGMYQDISTASQLFPSIAQKYLLDNIRVKAEDIHGELDSLANRLS